MDCPSFDHHIHGALLMITHIPIPLSQRPCLTFSGVRSWVRFVLQAAWICTFLLLGIRHSVAENPPANPILAWPKSLQPLLGYADLYWVADDVGLLQVNGLPIWTSSGNIARMRQTVMLGASDVLTFKISDNQKGSSGSLEFAMLRVGEPMVLSKDIGSTANPAEDFATNPSMSGSQKFLIPSSKTGIMRLQLPGLPKENLSWPPTRPEVAYFKWVAPPATDLTAAAGYDSPDLNVLRTLYGNRCRAIRNDFEALMTRQRAKYVEALRGLHKPVPAVQEEIDYFAQ